MLVRSVFLHGALAEEFGEEHKLAVSSAAEAIRALRSQFYGFAQAIRAGDWQIFMGDPDTDGRDLALEELSFQRLQVPIHIVPAAAGAKKKGLGKLVAGVALIGLSIYTAGASGPFGTSLGFDATIAGTSITLSDVALFGVGLALSGVASFLSPTPEIASIGDPAEEKKSAIFQGPINTPEQGGPIPIVYGRRFEVGSVVVSAGITTEQVEILPESSEDPATGGGGSGGSNSRGDSNPDPDVGGDAGGGEAGAGSGGVGDPDGDGNPGGAKGGGKSGGGSGRVAVEAKNTLRSVATARLVDLISEGEIGGIIGLAKGIKIGGTQLQSESGQYNFAGVNWAVRTGLPTQDHLPGLGQAENEIEVGLEVKKETPIPVTISNPEVDAVRVTMRLPELFKQNKENGDVEAYGVAYNIELESNGGGYQVVHEEVFEDEKCTSAYERSYRIELPKGGAPWNIRAVRVTDDADELVFRNETWFSRYTEIIDAKFMYPNCALVGLEVDAEQFGDKVAERSYLVEGVKVLVPSNYDPVTRTYSTAVWDGTFAPAKVSTDNPAWIVYDLITSNRYGLGRLLPVAQLSKWDLYEIGKYCDEYVPDGFGGSEPRFTFNGVLKTREQALQIVTFILSAARAATYWGAGGLFMTQDRPKDPTRLVSPANVEGGEFTYTGTAAKARHSMAQVSWHDPDDGYRASAIEVVEDVEAIHKRGLRIKQLVAWGTTTRGQARRIGKWVLDTEQNQTQTVQYVAGMDHADAFPGDVIEIADPAVMAVRAGGRLKGAIGVDLVIDAPVTIFSGEDYWLNVLLPDGKIERRRIVSLPGDLTALKVEAAFSVDPEAGAMWSIHAGNLAPTQWVILDRQEVEVGKYQITALEYDPTKFARVEQGIQFDPASHSAFPTGPLKMPTNLSLKEYLYPGQVTAIKSAVLFSWSQPKDARVTRYDAEYRKGLGEWREAGSTSRSSVDIRDTEDGPWSFRVRSRDGLGRRSSWVVLTADLVTLQAPPNDVENLTGVVKGETLHLSWDPVSDLDLDHYVVKFIYDGAPVSWASGIVLDGAIHKDVTSLTVPAAAGTYMIKAVDTSEVQSVNATLLYSNVASLFGLNVVENLPQAPGWAGTKTNLEVFGTDLLLAAGDSLADWGALDAVTTLYQGASGTVETAGTYEVFEVVDQGRPATVRITTELDVSGVALDGLGTDLQSLNYKAGFEFASTDDDPAASPTWSAWRPLLVGDYHARAFKFRLKLEALDIDTRPVVSQASVRVDVPDRFEKDVGVLCGAGGLAVPYADAFRVPPVLTITANDLAGGDVHHITSTDESGFIIRFEDAAGSPIARSFNYVAQGYGYGT